MLRSLRDRIPDVRVTIVLSAEGEADAMEDSDLVDEVFTLQEKRVFRKIRDDWPDLAIATGNGIMIAKMAFRTGARYRLGFKYDHMSKHETGFLFTHTVSLDKTIPGSEQLMNLIRTLL